MKDPGQLIPFNRPFTTGQELEYIRDAIGRDHLSGDGPYTRLCRDLLEGFLLGSHVLLTSSCTDALELSALLLGVGPGDEVIVPSYTFVSTANAFALRGATIRFADIRSDTLNMCPEHVAQLVNSRTKAIVPVHYAGVACDMDALGDLAAGAGAAIVEDAAHALFGRYRGTPLGCLGKLATLSFHETKNLSCGEGGALVVNDPELLLRAEIMREKGTNRSACFRGEVDRYTWVDLGSSFLPSELSAAFLYAQLLASESILARRLQLWQGYRQGLEGWARRWGVELPFVPEGCDHPAHLFYLVLPSADMVQPFIAHLRAHQVQSVFHYQPLHLSVMGQRFGGRVGDCPVTEDISQRIVRLPLFTGLLMEEQAYIVDIVTGYTFGH